MGALEQSKSKKLAPLTHTWSECVENHAGMETDVSNNKVAESDEQKDQLKALNIRRLYRKWREAVRVLPYVKHWVRYCDDFEYKLLKDGEQREEANRLLEEAIQSKQRAFKRKLSDTEV